MTARSRNELQRETIKPPVAFQPYSGRPAPQPHRADKSIIPVEVFLNPDGYVVERWTFSGTDVRWYLLKELDEKGGFYRAMKREAVSAT
jgi:hypothetical protein